MGLVTAFRHCGFLLTKVKNSSRLLFWTAQDLLREETAQADVLVLEVLSWLVMGLMKTCAGSWMAVTWTLNMLPVGSTNSGVLDTFKSGGDGGGWGNSRSSDCSLSIIWREKKDILTYSDRKKKHRHVRTHARKQTTGSSFCFLLVSLKAIIIIFHIREKGLSNSY